MKKLLIPLNLMLVSLLFPAASAQTQSADPVTQTPQLTRPRTVGIPAQQQPTPKTPIDQPVIAKPKVPVPAVISPAPTAKPLPTPSPTPAQPTTLPVIPATQSTSTSVSVPSVPNPVASAALLPAVQRIPFDKARTRIAEAKRLFRTRPALTAMISPSALPTVATAPSLYFVKVAAADPETGQIHLLTLPKQSFLTPNTEIPLTTSLGTPVRLRVLRPNYVNTAVAIFDNTGRSLAPLVVEYPIEKFGKFREMAYYTSAHPALLTPEMVKAGQTYVRTMLDLAAKRLRDKGVLISPKIIDVAERLCVVEHADHGRFQRENRLALYEEVFALYALNELDTYRYSVSTAGAGGMVQMIPWAYQMLRQRHPGVGLNPDFVLGMRNHGNALEAMLLYMQGTWNDLVQSPDVTDALSTGIATQAELVAAGYNSNAARLPSYIRRGGDAWRTLIPRETQMYLQIYKSLESLVPIKARAS